jgi:hypothetical protein
LVELTADTGRALQDGGVFKDAPAAAPDTPADSPTATAPPVQAPETPEPMLTAPTTDDFLPAPAPLGQEANEPVHQTAEDSHAVEGAPGLVTPADTLPQAEAPTNPPEESTAGPDRPHNF